MFNKRPLFPPPSVMLLRCEGCFPPLLYCHLWPQGGTTHHHSAPNPSRGALGRLRWAKLGRLGEPAAVRHRPEQSLFTGTPVFNPRGSDRSSGGGRAPAPPPHPTSQTHVSPSSRHVQDVVGFGVLVVHYCGRIKIGSVFSWIRKEGHDVNERRNRLILDRHRCLFFLPNSLHDGACSGQRHLLIIHFDFSCDDSISFNTTSTVIS